MQQNEIELIELYRKNVETKTAEDAQALCVKLFDEINHLKNKLSMAVEDRKTIWKRIHGLSYESTEWTHGEHPRIVELSEIDDLFNELEGQNE